MRFALSIAIAISMGGAPFCENQLKNWFKVVSAEQAVVVLKVEPLKSIRKNEHP